MLYYLPDLQHANLPEQTEVQNKICGIPWGVPASKWPKCKQCQKSQTLLAQFIHHPQILNLGREGRVLNVFMCCNFESDGCETWDAASGANACFILEPEALEDHLSAIPADNPFVESQGLVVGWFEQDDGFSTAETKAFYHAEEYFALDDEKLFEVSSTTRLGGVPDWIQSPEDVPENCRFVGQLNEPYAKVSGDCGIAFGDYGRGYIFLEDTHANAVPKGYFFWQSS